MRFDHLVTKFIKHSDMRNRFDQQLTIGQLPIEATYINPKSKNAVDELIAALKEIYCNEEYNEHIFSVLDKHINADKKQTGRKGMNLWVIFVLAQLRLCLNLSYEMLHNLANNHRTLRHLMGVEHEFGMPRQEFEYQNIYDNVSALDDELVVELNRIILDFGHGQVFKKKEETALRLKSDSFVVESNVHFPTDYNLLWDCARKCLDTVSKFIKKNKTQQGWRKLNDWRRETKGLMRELGKASASGGKNKKDRMRVAAENYLVKARALSVKLTDSLAGFPLNDTTDLSLHITLEYFISLMDKHIDLVDRRILKGEKIPHHEKLFSVFEQYTEWINKGKSNPSVELGKKLMITTDQFNLIVDYQLMQNQQDRDVTIELADRVLPKHKVVSWSFDKGFWSKKDKELLETEIPKVIMPKLGKRTEQEKKLEKNKAYTRLKNRHSAIESNINELENRGLDRCPDRGIVHFKRYVGLAVCAYNLKKIGREILKQKRLEQPVRISA